MDKLARNAHSNARSNNASAYTQKIVHVCVYSNDNKIFVRRLGAYDRHGTAERLDDFRSVGALPV